MPKATTKKIGRKKRSKPATKVDYSMKQKLEMVLAWECNGYVLDGRKYSRPELAELLEVTEYRLEKLIDETRKGFTRMFETNSAMRNVLYVVAGTFYHQIREDRARAVIHSDNLNKLIYQTTCELDQLKLVSEATPTESKRKRLRRTHLQNTLKHLYAQQLEGLKLLTQTSNALSHFMEFFTRGTHGQHPPVNLFHPDLNVDGEQKLVTYIDAIRIIETRTEPILPRQDIKQFDQSPRNPNAGFEELAPPKNNGRS